MVLDVGNWEESSFRLPGGQSGNPLSPHYDDMLPLWKRGAGVPIAWSPELVASAARETLGLMPSDG
jgi:penicillin amidase